jgi:glucosamine--fructose-6-phosphate aminotransferase (isomerizing)
MIAQFERGTFHNDGKNQYSTWARHLCRRICARHDECFSFREAMSFDSTHSNYYREISEQPSALQRLVDNSSIDIDALAQDIARSAPVFAVFAGRGSSANAARYGQYLLAIRNSITVALAIPSAFTLYGATPRMERSITVGISQSGQSPDIVAVVQSATNQGALTVALTNDPKSPLAHAARHTIELGVGAECSIAATKTCTAEFLVMDMLSEALDGTPRGRSELVEVPACVSQTIEMNERLRMVEIPITEPVVIVARGYCLSAAFEIALKLKEVAGMPAEPYSLADFLHGPIAMMDERFTVLLVAPVGLANADMPKLVEVVKERRARLVVVSNDDELLAQSDIALHIPHTVPEWLSPITAIVAGQLLAGALAIAKGLDPDVPRGLTKVTLTR